MLARQAAAAVGVTTCWPWETAATLPSARPREALRRQRGEEGAGHIVATARLQLVFVVSFYIFYSAVLLCYGRHFSGLLAFGVINDDDDDDDNLAVDTEA